MPRNRAEDDDDDNDDIGEDVSHASESSIHEREAKDAKVATIRPLSVSKVDPVVDTWSGPLRRAGTNGRQRERVMRPQLTLIHSESPHFFFLYFGCALATSVAYRILSRMSPYVPRLRLFYHIIIID